MKLLIASRNVHKIRELRTMLKALKRFDVFSLIDFPEYSPTEESGATFEQNATQKALQAARTLNCLTLADDSGLVVPALGGIPGVHSARFAGDNASDKDNRLKLLQSMRDLKEQERSAYLECVLVLATPEGVKKSTKALCEGSIAEQERGGQGFGYDCLFIKHEYNKTFAELEEEVKNRISHRRKAFDKIIPFLDSLEDSSKN